MKRILIPALVAVLSLSPALAEEEGEGFSLMEKGAKLFLRGLMDEAEPAMKDMQRLFEGMEPALRQFMQDMGPALSDLMGKVDDLTLYEAPEMLPNGDIILRRKPDAPELQLKPLPDGEVEL